MNIKSTYIATLIILMMLLFLLIIPFIRYSVGFIKNIFTKKDKAIKNFYLDRTYEIKIEKSEHKKINYIQTINGTTRYLGNQIPLPYKIKFIDLNKNIFQKIFMWDQIIVQVTVKKA